MSSHDTTSATWSSPLWPKQNLKKLTTKPVSQLSVRILPPVAPPVVSLHSLYRS